MKNYDDEIFNISQRELGRFSLTNLPQEEIDNIIIPDSDIRKISKRLLSMGWKTVICKLIPTESIVVGKTIPIGATFDCNISDDWGSETIIWDRRDHPDTIISRAYLRYEEYRNFMDTVADEK